MNKRATIALLVVFGVTVVTFAQRTLSGSTNMPRVPSAPRMSFADQTLRISPTGRVHSSASIDGGISPELIPDTLAYHYFLRVTANVASDRTDERRIKGYFRHIGLHDDDGSTAEVLMGIARDYQQSLAIVQARLSSPDAVAATIHFRIDWDALVRRMTNRIQQELQPDRAALVDAYVMHHVRRNIKISQR